MCGSVGIFEINVVLTPSEIEEYNQQGKQYIETLARKIQRTPSSYKSIHIETSPSRPHISNSDNEDEKGTQRK